MCNTLTIGPWTSLSLIVLYVQEFYERERQTQGERERGGEGGREGEREIFNGSQKLSK